MGARIGQRPADQAPNWTVDVVVKRGATVVDVGDQQWVLPFANGIGQIAWAFTTPATIPAAGTWSLTVDSLAAFDDQDVGIVIVGSAISPVSLSGGVLSTPAVIAANTRFTIRGAVTVL